MWACCSIDQLCRNVRNMTIEALDMIHGAYCLDLESGMRMGLDGYRC